MPAELNHSQISTRATSSLILLISRSGYLQLISSAGVFFLTLFLAPAEFGLFFIVNEIIGIMGYFSDVGLAASLIQKTSRPSLKALRTSFTLQQILVLTLCAVVVFLSTWIQRVYELDDQGIWLLRALLVSFFLSSLKTIPSVLLERVLQFHKLVIVETVETILFYTIAVYLAYKGHGALSYAYAVIARGLAGVVLIYILAPWKVGISFSMTELKDLFKFGLPYQGNTFIAAIKDRLLNLFLADAIGPYGMGIIGWAQTWSQKSLRFVSDNITKVTFPAFSRLQDNPQRLRSSIERMLFFSAASVFPILVGTGVIIEPLLRLIPIPDVGTYYDKWHPALFAFYLYLFNSAWASVSTPISNTLAAVGHIKTVSKLMVMWTVLTWGIIAPMGYFYGYNGVAVGVAFVSLFSVIPVWLLQRKVPFSFNSQIFPGLFSSLIMGIIVYTITRQLSLSVTNLIIAISAGVIIYVTILMLIAGQQCLEYVTILKKTFLRKS